MEKDFRLEEIFDAYRPDLGDGAKFMATLQPSGGTAAG